MDGRYVPWAVVALPPVKINKRVRARLAALVEKGWKQNALAKAVGRSEAWMTRYLQGHGTIDSDQLELLAAFLEISVSDLIGLQEPQRSDVQTGNRPATPNDGPPFRRQGKRA